MGLIVRVPPSLAGRIEQQGLCAQLLDESATGQVRVLLVQGEPGIGKTRLLRHLQAEAEQRGFRTGLGRAQEDDSRPLGAISETLRPLLRGATWEAAEYPDTVRRLAKHLLRASAEHPIVLAIDDLQWAGRLTSSLFSDVAVALIGTASGHARVLMVGAHRPPTPDTPWLEPLARLRRERAVRSLSLSGLRPVELHELVRLATGAVCSAPLLAQLAATTRGNPLLALETIEALERVDGLTVEGGVLRARSEMQYLALPSDAVGLFRTRVETIPSAQREALTIAAIVAASFSLEQLECVTEVPSADLLALVEQSLAERLLVETEEGFEFAHPALRHALSTSWSAERRRRAHLLIAQRLHARDHLETDEPEIAHHYLASHAHRLDHSVFDLIARAGVQAAAVGGWPEAVRYLDAALADEAFSSGLDLPRRALLRYQAARACLFSPDPARARVLFSQAIADYRACGDDEGWGLAVAGWARAHMAYGTPLEDGAQLVDFLENARGAGAASRADVVAQQASAFWLARSAQDAPTAALAVKLALEGEEPVSLANAHLMLGLAHLRALDPAAALAAFEAADQAAKRSDDPRVAGWGVQRIPVPLIMLGRLAEAVQIAKIASEHGRDSMDCSWPALAFTALATVDSLRGLDSAEALFAEAALHVRRSRYAAAAQVLFPELAKLRALSGRADEVADAEREWEAWARPGAARGFRLLQMARAGGSEAVRFELQQRPLSQPWRKAADFNALGHLAVAVELAAEIGAPELAEAGYAVFTDMARREIALTIAPAHLVARLAGKAAMALSRDSEAEAWFETAVKIGTAIGANPESAITKLDWATLKRRTGDPVAALSLAQAAEAEFHAMGLDGGASQATAIVRSLAPASTPPVRRHEQSPGSLSSREREVLELVVTGCTNQQIADDLVISLNTVATHVRSIFNKTGSSNRASVTRWALRNGSPT